MLKKAGSESRNKAALRKKAEKRFSERPEKERQPDDLSSIIHELEVHQIELEIQNEDLLQAQLELEASQARYFDLYDFAPVGYLTINEKGMISEMNLTAAGLLGIEIKSLVSKPFSYFIKSEFQDMFYHHRKKVIESSTKQTCELVLKKNDDTFFHAGLDSIGLEINGQWLMRIALTDITERKQTEEKLYKSREQFRAVADFTYDWESWIGPDGKVIWNSPGVSRFTGYSSQECMDMMGFPVSLVYEDDRDKTTKHFEGALQGSSGNDIEFRICCKDGGLKWASASWQPIYDENGNNLGHRSSVRDITERKKTENALRDSEEKYRQLVENINIGICVAQDGMLKFVNPMLVKIFGHSEHDLTSLPFTEYIHPDDRNMVLERHIRRIKGEKFPTRYEFRISASDGSIKWVELDSVMIQWQDKPAVLAFVGNITDRKQVDEELNKYRNQLEQLVEERTDQLKSSENKYRTLFENANDAVFIIKNNVFIDCNVNAQELFGYTKEQIAGKTPFFFSPPLQSDGSDSREQATEKMDTAASGIAQHFEWQHRRSNGTILDTEIDLHAIEVGGERLLQGVVRDITEHKQAEKVLEQKENDLLNKAMALEELNTALKVLLQQKTKDEKELEERFASNIGQLVLPYLEKIKKGSLDSEQTSCLSIIELNLNEIISPFLHKIKQLNFTPREAQVASLIKNGKSTKEISAILGVAASAVDTYRNKIRSKLNLNNKKVNLQAHLQSFE